MDNMPFKSKAQVGYMYATHPEESKEFAAKTPSIKSLPAHVKKQASRDAMLKHMKGY